VPNEEPVDATPTGNAPRRAGWLHDLRLVIGTFVVAVVVVLAIDNRGDVRLHWVFGDGSAPLALVVVVSAAAGALVSWLVLHRVRRRG